LDVRKKADFMAQAIPQNLQVALTGLPAYPVKWTWLGRDDGQPPDQGSFRLIAGERLVIPGVLSKNLTDWRKQKWKFMKPEAEIATRQLLIFQPSGDGDFDIEWWDGVRDVTEPDVDSPIILPRIGRTDQNGHYTFRDETSANYVLHNTSNADMGIYVLAVYDTPLEATGSSGAFGGS
jgi:hypothetical protein